MFSSLAYVGELGASKGMWLGSSGVTKRVDH